MDALQEQKSTTLRRRLWGAAVLLALLVIFLPLLLDGSGSESNSNSKYRRVERLRAEPPIIINSEGVPENVVESASDSSVLPVNSTSGQSGSSNQSELARRSNQDGQGQQDDQGGQGQGGQGQQGGQIRQDKQGSQVGQSGQQGDNAGQGQQAGQADEFEWGEQNAQGEQLTAGDEPVVDTDAASQARTDDSAPSETGRMSAWVVQAGSFADETNALAIRDKLRQAGYPSFVTPNDAEPPLYRVRVGPMIDFQQAESKRDEVIDYLRREAIVVSYP